MSEDQPKKYQKIDNQQRKLVLDLLFKEKLSLQEVANRLQLKYCTVRTIQKAYEEDGRIGKKETRKKKLKVQSILKISILNPLTLQIQPISELKDAQQIYVDKQLTMQDQIHIANEQKQLITQQCQKFTQQIVTQLTKSNILYQQTMQNILLSSQFLFKQMLEITRPVQEFDSTTYPTFYPITRPYIRT